LYQLLHNDGIDTVDMSTDVQDDKAIRRQNSIRLIRLSGVAAVIAGALRVLTSFLPPLTGRAMALYLIVDVLLLFGCVGLYEFKRVAIKFLETFGLLLETFGALILIARDLSLLSSEVYPVGALLFAAGIDLFAIGSWKSRTFPRWILLILILSTVVGPIGFFTSSLGILFATSGILFGIGFISAGVAMILPRRPDDDIE
jgi:hypothetical protein